MTNYYIYIWYIKDSFHVFYVGRGHGNRYKTLKKRTKYFHDFYDKYDCDSIIIKDNLDEISSIQLEQVFIAYYRQKHMANANIHNGGKFGGDVITNMPNADKNKFIKKMTDINTKRCQTDTFRNLQRQRLIDRYKNDNERQKQSDMQKHIWTDKKKKEQSIIIKTAYKNHPNMKHKNEKACILEFNNEIIKFNSKKELQNYAKEKYGFSCSRKIEQKLLYQKCPYIAFSKKYQKYNGLKMYYVA